MPPPNVTGDLHLGHALNGSIQDVLVRWHRMRGYGTLWQPGYDHAGISTQNVVEKQLAQEGLTRHDLGREAFIERTWEWLERDGAHDHGAVPAARRLARLQPRAVHPRRGLLASGDGVLRAALGARLDLSRRTGSSTGARSTRPRSPTSRWSTWRWTTCSTYVRYPFADGDGTDGIVIATVRPATILGDVAVAVHPDDERYRDAVGREVVVPYVERAVPVIADARVDPAFGSGALKITPGHDHWTSRSVATTGCRSRW